MKKDRSGSPHQTVSERTDYADQSGQLRAPFNKELERSDQVVRSVAGLSTHLEATPRHPCQEGQADASAYPPANSYLRACPSQLLEAAHSSRHVFNPASVGRNSGGMARKKSPTG